MEKTAITGTAAGVPFLAHPPEGDQQKNAPTVIAWHLFDPPRSETAMAAALPLRGLPAWRIYLGLPMHGARMPADPEAFFGQAMQDAVLNLFGPILRQAFTEFPAALAELRGELPLGDGPVGLLGGSAGAVLPQLIMAESDLDVAAAALVSPAIQLAKVVAANERQFGTAYAWSEESRAIADRFDFIARSDEIAKRGAAVLLVTGERDEPEFREPAELLWGRLTDASGPDRASLVGIPGMGHALAEEPGMEPAPQTADAVRVDAVVADWFRRHLL